MKRVLLVLVCALAFPAAAAAAPDPVVWCGNGEVTQDRVPDLDVASPDQIRFVYAIPADGVDDFAAVASGIATDAAWIDGWWRAQDPTRAPRFDRYPFPGCTSTFGSLDIGFVRLPSPATAYIRPTGTAQRLDRDLAGLFPPTQKTVVYYDGRTFDGDVCGETDYLADRTGGDTGIAYVYLDSGCGLTPVGSSASAQVAAHELLHNLGAVPDEAPHLCDGTGSHACDDPSDVMYPFLAPDTTLDAVVLDVGRDDYYAHAGTWWDVRNSDWLTHLPQQPVSLAVAGGGTLAASTGKSLLPCGGGCDALPLDEGESVSVQAVAAAGWAFDSWSGACSGHVSSCTLRVGGPTAATALFVRAPLRVTVSVRGRGRVHSTPVGVDCPGVCRVSFTPRTVRLAAVAARGWRFAGWSGACTGRAACRVSGSAAVSARFVRAAL
ncbi:MAG TPA: hypothetical protein VFL60_09950 [Gaiellaceae bacterium]|nr:hypothetical protein [Gaiellaceae bacterium]